jgi:hypothetical protein
LIVTTAGATAVGAEETYRGTILYPTSDAPEKVSAENTVDIQVALRLPLTPPPGVQQPAANKGWEIIFSRDNLYDESGKPARIQYRFPVMRLRPVVGDIYRVTVEIAPWLPDIRYDLTVSGPGFHAQSPGAVIKGTIDDHRQSGPTVVASDGGFLITTSGSAPPKKTWMVVISKNSPGIALTVNKQRARPTSVVPAQIPGDGSRLATFIIDVNHVDEQRPTSERIDIKTVTPVACNAKMTWEDLATNQVLEWRTLSVVTPTPPINIVWDFGDGRYGEGTSVRHRFLLSNTAMVTAVTFDDSGRICTVRKKLELNSLITDSGCGCTLVGR